MPVFSVSASAASALRACSEQSFRGGHVGSEKSLVWLPLPLFTDPNLEYVSHGDDAQASSTSFGSTFIILHTSIIILPLLDSDRCTSSRVDTSDSAFWNPIPGVAELIPSFVASFINVLRSVSAHCVQDCIAAGHSRFSAGCHEHEISLSTSGSQSTKYLQRRGERFLSAMILQTEYLLL